MNTQIQKLNALVQVELKKLVRDPMILGVQVLMPVGLCLVFYLALSGVRNDYYGYAVETHFEYLLPGVMGYAVIYMAMMVARSLADYRQTGLLNRVEVTPVSPATYLGSHIIANMLIASAQGFIVLLVARLLGFEPQGGVIGLLIVGAFLALLGVTAVGMGMLTAVVAKDSGAAGGLAAIYIVPMMMFGANLAVFNDMTRTVASFMPNYYVTDSLSVILHTGEISDPVIFKNFLILSAITIVIVLIGIQLFSKTAFRSN